VLGTPVLAEADARKRLVGKRVDPQFPPLGRQARLQGVVVLDVTVAADGSVKEINLVQGHPMLAPSAIEAVKQWRFKPYLNSDGSASEFKTRINVAFSIAGG
jgi:periplasmic protein TonB